MELAIPPSSTFSGNHEFPCLWEACGKVFHRSCDLIRHYRTHTNERPYKCTFEGCEKRFNHNTTLTAHLRTHTGEKPFICGFTGCDKAFADSSSFARHRRTHTQEKPYFCSINGCWRWFSRKSGLDKHQRRHLREERIITEPSSGCYPSLFQHRNDVPTPSSIQMNDNFSPPLPGSGAQHTIGTSTGFPTDLEYADEAETQWMHFTQAASDLENSPSVSFFTPTYAEHRYNGSSLQQY